MSIITSLLDTDLYKFTMWQVALNQFPTTHVKYEFKCRNHADWDERSLREINEEIDQYCTLMLSGEEIEYLKGFSFFTEGFLNFLSLYKPNRDHISVGLRDGELTIEATGPWFLTIPFEVPVLAIVNEVYFRNHHPENEEVRRSGRSRLLAKKELFSPYALKDFTFIDFGTRRRYSRKWHEEVVKELQDLDVFVGTSNIDLARRFGIKPIGTMAHEFMMVGQAQNDVPLVRSQHRMLQSWVDEYRGDLGIALSDTLGIDAFLRDFDLYFAKLYDGLRHDSGDPLWWSEKVLSHYENLGIDPNTKTLVFSDGLNPKKAIEIAGALKGRTKVSFGIGTNLTNDFEGIEPLQIVMKIVEANGKPVAKVSDSPGKGMCHDPEFLSYLRKVFEIKG